MAFNKDDRLVTLCLLLPQTRRYFAAFTKSDTAGELRNAEKPESAASKACLLMTYVMAFQRRYKQFASSIKSAEEPSMFGFLKCPQLEGQPDVLWFAPAR